MRNIYIRTSDLPAAVEIAELQEKLQHAHMEVCIHTLCGYSPHVNLTCLHLEFEGRTLIESPGVASDLAYGEVSYILARISCESVRVLTWSVHCVLDVDNSLAVITSQNEALNASFSESFNDMALEINTLKQQLTQSQEVVQSLESQLQQQQQQQQQSASANTHEHAHSQHLDHGLHSQLQQATRRLSAIAEERYIGIQWSLHIDHGTDVYM